jgi:hypothetical protein
MCACKHCICAKAHVVSVCQAHYRASVYQDTGRCLFSVNTVYVAGDNAAHDPRQNERKRRPNEDKFDDILTYQQGVLIVYGHGELLLQDDWIHEGLPQAPCTTRYRMYLNA